MPVPRQKGLLIEWNDQKGYGFIAPFGAKNKIFVHISEIRPRRRRPVINDKLNFEVAADADGKSRAIKVRMESLKSPISPRRTETYFAVGVVAGFFLSLLLAILYGYCELRDFYYYVGVSVLTFFSYLRDKRDAVKGKWRTPENTLHLFELLGGWPGGLLAQRFLRHKSSKTTYQIVFWLAVMTNVFFFLWLKGLIGLPVLWGS